MAAWVSSANDPLIVAENVRTGERENSCQQIEFLSEMAFGPLRELLRVAFGTLESGSGVSREAKEELGWGSLRMSRWACVHRHMIVTVVAQLFCARRSDNKLCASEIVTDMPSV